MKKIFVILSIIILIFSENTSKAINPNDWTNYLENDSIKVEYAYSNCQYARNFNQEFVMLKITNKLKTDVIIEWKELLWYDDKCINCEQYNPEFRKEIVVKAKSTVIGDCNTNNSLKIFSKFTDKIEDLPIIGVEKIAVLTKFELKNITVK